MCNKCNAFESLRNHPLAPRSVEELSFRKLVPDAKTGWGPLVYWTRELPVPRAEVSRSVVIIHTKTSPPICLSPQALESTFLSCSPHQRHSAGVYREKGKGQKVLVATKCCQASLQDKASQSFTTSFSIRKMSSTLKAASQASKGSMLSTLSAFTGSETKGCFPEDTQNPCWSQDGRKTGERGVSGRRKTPASLSEVGVPGVLSGPHHDHLSSSLRSMITSYSAKSSCI